MSSKRLDQAAMYLQLDASCIQCDGAWTVTGVTHLQSRWPTVQWTSTQPLTIDGSAITRFDSAGAWLICRLIDTIQAQGGTVILDGFDREKTELMTLLQQHANALDTADMPIVSQLARFKTRVQHGIMRLSAVFAFIGETSDYLWRTLCQPFRLHARELINVIQQTGYYALPIIGLLSFLVGVVLAYQTGLQLKSYGANLYIVDLLGIAIVREFGPLITAVIVAGRTGAAYTAEIGTMKVNEELDALHTLGVSPVEILSIPRILGLMIVFPLLTIWSILFGLAGGVMMSNHLLDIDMYHFLQRFHEVISLHTYYLGMIKTPVFSLLIASVGCYHGFRVSGGAHSVGRETTKSVVHSIFLIIIADAIFSLIFGWQNV